MVHLPSTPSHKKTPSETRGGWVAAEGARGRISLHLSTTGSSLSTGRRWACFLIGLGGTSRKGHLLGKYRFIETPVRKTY